MAIIYSVYSLIGNSIIHTATNILLAKSFHFLPLIDGFWLVSQTHRLHAWEGKRSIWGFQRLNDQINRCTADEIV